VILNNLAKRHAIPMCIHGHRQRGQGGRGPWIFIHDTDKVEGGL